MYEYFMFDCFIFKTLIVFSFNQVTLYSFSYAGSPDSFL